MTDELSEKTKDQLKYMAKIALMDEKFDEKYVIAIKDQKPENLVESQKTIRHYQSWIGALKIAAKIAMSFNIMNLLNYLAKLNLDLSFLANLFTVGGI